VPANENDASYDRSGTPSYWLYFSIKQKEKATCHPRVSVLLCPQEALNEGDWLSMAEVIKGYSKVVRT
jgi:hypothetical protein